MRGSMGSPLQRQADGVPALDGEICALQAHGQAHGPCASRARGDRPFAVTQPPSDAPLGLGAPRSASSSMAVVGAIAVRPVPPRGCKRARVAVAGCRLQFLLDGGRHPSMESRKSGHNSGPTTMHATRKQRSVKWCSRGTSPLLPLPAERGRRICATIALSRSVSCVQPKGRRVRNE